MKWKGYQRLSSRITVERLADQIEDPVAKLRFLKTMAASPGVRFGKSRTAFCFLVLPVLFVFPVIFLLRFQIPNEGFGSSPPRIALAAPARTHLQDPPVEPPSVWQVERTASEEVYSNGLRIETGLETGTHPRRYWVFAANRGGNRPQERRVTPAGIVFHATESRQAPFEERENGTLKKFGESMLEYVRRKSAYHFVIDRFGRVYRIVRETDAAFHAGYSLWADDRWIYLNLNDSFLAVSFEAGPGAGREMAITPAQQRAGAMLVEMLRSRYSLPAANCVTHAQVSVNPDNMRVGYHTDWAANFPFEALGLPNNYDEPIQAVTTFGFQCDAAFLNRASERLRKAAQISEQMLLGRAAAEGLSLAPYRHQLHRQYHRQLALIQLASSAASSSNSEVASAVR
jgi:hypothetical protein